MKRDSRFRVLAMGLLALSAACGTRTEYYPDGDPVPELALSFDEKDLALYKQKVLSITAFGDGAEWSGKTDESATSTTITFTTNPGGQLFALASGTVVEAEKIAGTTYKIWVRHGRRFLVVHDQVRDPSVAIGDTVARGQAIGKLPVKTVLSVERTYFSAQIYARVGAHVYAYPLIDWLDSGSVAILGQLWNEFDFTDLQSAARRPFAALDRVEVTGRVRQELFH